MSQCALYHVITCVDMSWDSIRCDQEVACHYDDTSQHLLTGDWITMEIVRSRSIGKTLWISYKVRLNRWSMFSTYLDAIARVVTT